MNRIDRTLARCLSSLATDVRALQRATLATGASLPPSFSAQVMDSLSNLLEASELLDFAEGAADQILLPTEEDEPAAGEQPFARPQEIGRSPWLAAAVAASDRLAAAGVDLGFGRSPLVDQPDPPGWACPIDLACESNPCAKATWCSDMAHRLACGLIGGGGGGQHDADRSDGGLHSEPLPSDYPPTPPKRGNCPKGATCISEPCPWLDYCRSATARPAQQPIATEVHCPQDHHKCGAECIWRTHCGLMAGGYPA